MPQMMTIRATDHDMGCADLTIKRPVSEVEFSKRLFGECGYRKIIVTAVGFEGLDDEDLRGWFEMLCEGDSAPTREEMIGKLRAKCNG
jgi:hypothetical protein